MPHDICRRTNKAVAIVVNGRVGLTRPRFAGDKILNGTLVIHYWGDWRCAGTVEGMEFRPLGKARPMASSSDFPIPSSLDVLLPILSPVIRRRHSYRAVLETWMRPGSKY